MMRTMMILIMIPMMVMLFGVWDVIVAVVATIAPTTLTTAAFQYPSTVSLIPQSSLSLQRRKYSVISTTTTHGKIPSTRPRLCCVELSTLQHSMRPFLTLYSSSTDDNDGETYDKTNNNNNNNNNINNTNNNNNNGNKAHDVTTELPIDTTTPTSTTGTTTTTTASNENNVAIVVDETEHDAAVLNRLLRPYQYIDLIQTIVGRSILLVVVFGFGLQFFGYSYIIEYDNDIIVTTTTTSNQGMVVTSSKVQHTQPPKFRIGTIEERDFLQEIRKDMKQ